MVRTVSAVGEMSTADVRGWRCVCVRNLLNGRIEFYVRVKCDFVRYMHACDVFRRNDAVRPNLAR